MNKEKVNKVVGELLRSGFNMTSNQFYETTIHKILKRYGIEVKLSVEEYYELLRQLIDVCAEFELKSAGIEFDDNDDWKYK